MEQIPRDAHPRLIQRLVGQLRIARGLVRSRVGGRGESNADEFAAIRTRYAVQARDWLDLEPSYEADGAARFITNPGTVSGPTTVRYAEDGSLAEFRMTARDLEIQNPIEGGDALFVFVNMLPIPDSPGSFSLGPGGNECASVELEGGGFRLTVAQRSSVIASAGDSDVSFKPYRTIARFPNTARPHFWVAPLLNFVVDFRRVVPSLREHPLRTRETARLVASEEHLRVYHEAFYREGNALIPFLCEGEPAFIEPLADYQERRARVEAGEVAVTAVAIGRTPEDFDFSASDWFPADLVTLLGLSSGRSVEVPYVEIRDEEGELLARMHVRIGDAGQSRGTALIEEQISGTTGGLLTSFLVSEVRGQVWFRVMLKHLLRAFTGGGTVEDRLSHLFRAAEGACAGLKLNNARPIEVEDKIRSEVESEIDALVKRLQEIAAHASEGDRARLAQLGNRLRMIAANNPSFATQLLTLVDKVGLPDARWLADFRFRVRNERPDGKPRMPMGWASAAGLYRNRIFHSAFIDFEAFDTDNAVAFIGHLSDVLTRVVFHLIGFVGQYRPPCGYAGAVTYETPSWARPDRLSARALRYID